MQTTLSPIPSTELSPLPNTWGEGALFGFSGLDGPTCSDSRFVATYRAQLYHLLWHTPRRRFLDVEIGPDYVTRIALSDVVMAETPDGELWMTFSHWHTLVGIAPAEASLTLRCEGEEPIVSQKYFCISPDTAHGDVLVLATRGQRFALSYGASVAEACERAEAGLENDAAAEAGKRLAFYENLLPPEQQVALDLSQQKLLTKCAGVMKVNTLGPEGAIRHTWSTPDRVPHQDMWLWDSVFHSFGMNCLSPQTSWDFLLAVLETQNSDGMICHQMNTRGKKSAITQPPLLAWGVWENYRMLGDKTHLEFALPRLARYIDWICRHRDDNHNHLFEWFIEGDELCRCGESGMDNSPRFDAAIKLDAVDFSVFMAQEMDYLAKMAEEIGQNQQAAAWRQQAKIISQAIHHELWDGENNFYYDRDFTGKLSPVRAVSGFYPLLLNDIPPQRVARLIEILYNPDYFNTAFPLPSVALAEASWCTDMWRGPTWINANYLVIRGLQKQGQHETARWLREKKIYFVQKYFERDGVLFEFYDAQDNAAPGECHRKGPVDKTYDLRSKVASIRDYHWSAALVLRLLMDLNSEELG